jgi:hypothetical protein
MVAGVWLAVTGIGLALHPDASGHGTHQQLGLPPCPSVLLFDRPCPGCGLTTCWCALLHGNFGLAFHAHPLGPFLYLGFTLLAVLCVYGFAVRKRVVLDSVQMSRVLIVCSVIFLAFGLGRMAVTPHFRTPTEQMFVTATTGR